MTVREYLERLDKNGKVTFIIAHSVKESAGRFYHYEYKTTPIHSVYQIIGEWVDEYLVINDDNPPIDFDGGWVKLYNSGYLKCAIITTKDDLLMRYGEKEGREMIDYYKEKFDKRK